MTNFSRSARDSQQEQQSGAARLPWLTPTLRELGSVAASTHKVDNVGRNDGGSGAMKRT